MSGKPSQIEKLMLDLRNPALVVPDENGGKSGVEKLMECMRDAGFSFTTN